MADSYVNITVPTPTQNPVPSADIRDHVFGGAKIDEFVTSMGWTYIDRFGQKHYTIEGINYLPQQAMTAYGYVILTGKTFTIGATINNPNEVLLNTADGEYYKWTGSFASGPKVVPANSTPASTGGIGPGAWIGVGDASLRAALAASDGEKLIGECPDVATLRTIEPSFDKQLITVREHTSGTRKGGGDFRAVLAGSSYTDNNGTVIKTTGGAVWLRENAEPTNPLMFGAIGDGIAVDSAAVTAALHNCKFHCTGLGLTYGIGATVTQDQATPTLFTNARLQYVSALGTAPMMRMKNAAHTMRNISFNGTGGTTESGLIWEGANTRDGGTVESCEFRYVGGAGIRISGDYTNRIFARYGIIKNCRFIKCGNTGVANDRASVIADGVNNFTFDGLIMTECNWGLYVRMDTTLADKARAPNNLIQNCHIFGSGQNHPTFIDAQGLSANRQDSLKVDNCWIGDFRDNGFDCGSSTGTQITNFRVNNCMDAIFIGYIDCDSYVIDNVVARDCERGVRIVMDGNIQSDGIVRNVRITNMLVTNPKYQGLYIGNTGANTGVFDIYLANVYVDSVSSWSLSSYTRPFHIEGIDGVFMDNCGTRYAKTHSVYFKKCDQAQLRGGRFQESDQSGGGTYAITVENDCTRISISEAIVYGKSTTGAVLLAGGSGHSAKHIRWRSAANGVSSSSATTPYLLDNMAF